MKTLGLVPLFYHPETEVAWQVVQACAEGGCPLVEFTHRGDRACEVFTDMARRRDEERPAVILGVGSVCDGATAAMYMASGADFVVGPLLDEQVARTCNSQKVAYLPGCGSVTEIHQAHLLGVEVCKIFPAGQVGGPSFIKSVMGPCKWAELMPSGGVSPTRENLSMWFDAGAACVGMGSQLIGADVLAEGAYEALTRQTRETLTFIAEIRSR
jgi:2-dehydro-3-deoxyphosphogluconate aldolase/(4S)-4-hydroxy-2-oxoglutarate aldolase